MTTSHYHKRSTLLYFNLHHLTLPFCIVHIFVRSVVGHFAYLGKLVLPSLIFLSDNSCKELDGKVDDLNTTEDRKASEEPHGAADEAELSLQGHLHIPPYLVIGGRVKIDLNQL